MLRTSVFFVKKLYAQAPDIACLALAALVLWVDYITGRAIQFPIVYALPVCLAAWRERKITAPLLAFFLPCARIIFYYAWHANLSLSIMALNAMIASAALLFYSYLVERVAWQTKELQKEVKVLKGLLPICAACKRIRNDKGDYEQIEHYIAGRTNASFSHGICPECAKKLYPEYFKDRPA